MRNSAHGHYSRHRLTAAVVAVVAASLALSGCSSSKSSSGGSGGSSSGGTITLAAIQDLTGPNSFIGGGALAGAKTAVEEINDSGGVNGIKLQLKTYDTTSTVTSGLSVIRTALSAKPYAVVGEMLSSVTAASLSLAKSGGVPWVTANYPNKNTVDIPNWYATSPDAMGVATGTAIGIKGLLGGSLNGKKIAFEGLTAPTVDANLAALKTVLASQGATLTQEIRDPIGMTSWTSQASNLAAAHPDALITINQEPQNEIIAKALSVAGFTAPILSSEGANSDTLLSTLHLANFHVVRSTIVPKKDSPIYGFASKAGVDSSEVGNPFFGKTYADVYVVAAVLAKCGKNCSASAFASTIKGLGDISVPNNILPGPLNFTKSQSGLSKAQVWSWDSSANASVAAGPAYAISE